MWCRWWLWCGGGRSGEGCGADGGCGGDGDGCGGDGGCGGDCGCDGDGCGGSDYGGGVGGDDLSNINSNTNKGDYIPHSSSLRD